MGTLRDLKKTPLVLLKCCENFFSKPKGLSIVSHIRGVQSVPIFFQQYTLVPMALANTPNDKEKLGIVSSFREPEFFYFERSEFCKANCKAK